MGYDWEYSTQGRSNLRSARDSESSDSTTYSFDATSDLVTDENNTSSASSYSSISPGPPNEQETAVNSDISQPHGRTSPTTSNGRGKDTFSTKPAPTKSEKASYNIRDLLKNTSPDPPKQLFNLTDSAFNTESSTKVNNEEYNLMNSNSTQSRDFYLRPIADEVGPENRAALPGDGAMLYNTPNIQFRHNKETFPRNTSDSNGQMYQPIADKPPSSLNMGIFAGGFKDSALSATKANYKLIDDRTEKAKFPLHSSRNTSVGFTPTHTQSTLGNTEAEKMSAEGLAYWRKPLIDQIVITDVTANFVTVTVKECLTDKGFFKARPSGIV